MAVLVVLVLAAAHLGGLAVCVRAALSEAGR